MQISDKYDLLQYLVDHMDSNNSYQDADHVLSKALNPLDLTQFIRELKSEGFIEVYLGADFRIYSKAIHFLAERNVAKSKATAIKKAGKSVSKWLAGVISGLIISLLAAYLIWRFGWK